eukprot:749665-Hanusia_phi.AAC.1
MYLRVPSEPLDTVLHSVHFLQSAQKRTKLFSPAYKLSSFSPWRAPPSVKLQSPVCERPANMHSAKGSQHHNFLIFSGEGDVGEMCHARQDIQERVLLYDQDRNSTTDRLTE